MRQRHEVQLTIEQRELCRAVMADSEEAIPVRRRAGILLHSDKQEPWRTSDDDVADEMGIDGRTVRRVRTAFVTQGFEKALWGAGLDPASSARISPRQEARLLILTATPPPPSYPRWTVRTLAEEIQGFADIPSISRELVRRILIRHKESARACPIEQETILQSSRSYRALHVDDANIPERGIGHAFVSTQDDPYIDSR